MSVFATKDGIENIFLRFDKNPARYQAGECLSGKIIVECGLTTPVKGIKVCSTSIKKMSKSSNFCRKMVELEIIFGLQFCHENSNL